MNYWTKGPNDYQFFLPHFLHRKFGHQEWIQKHNQVEQDTVGHLLVKPVGNLKFATNESFVMH